ncbi:MAG: hypothetical protein ABIQ30_13405, partial [Devosia sp.]
GEFAGEAVFTMGADGKSFLGTYTAEDNPKLTPELLQGTWSGKRASKNTATDFSGAWATETDKGWGYTFILSQQGNNVSGTYLVSDSDGKAAGTGSIVGTVKGRVVKFDWQQKPDFTGTGQFTMSANGKKFTGIYRADPHPDLPPEFMQGTWSGRRIVSN